MKVLSIDAWRDGDGWFWNNWFHVGDIDAEEINLDSARDVLRQMRERGYMAEGSQGLAAIDDDGYNVVIIARGTREPLFAIEYGSEV